MAPRAGTKEQGKGRPPPPQIEPPAEASASAAAEPKVAQLTEAEFKEALYRRLMAKHREVDGSLASIDAGRKAMAKGRTAIRNQLTQAGYLLKNVDNVLGDSSKTREPRHKQQDMVDQLHWMREMEGLPNPKTGEQLDLLARLPETERDAVAWEEDGYHQGVIDNACEIPAGCPPIFHQRWTKHWHDGQERRKWAMAAEVNVERDPVKAAAVGVSAVKLDPEEAGCATCADDGSGLADDVFTCPDCGAEYEPGAEPVAPADAVNDSRVAAGGDEDDDPGARFAEPEVESVH